MSSKTNPIEHQPVALQKDVVKARLAVHRRLQEFEHHLGRLAEKIDGSQVVAVALPMAKYGWRAFRFARKKTPVFIVAAGVVGGGFWLYKKWRAGQE